MRPLTPSGSECASDVGPNSHSILDTPPPYSNTRVLLFFMRLAAYLVPIVIVIVVIVVVVPIIIVPTMVSAV